MADLDLKAIRDSLVELAREAGHMITESNLNQDFSTDTKLNCEAPSPFPLSSDILAPPPPPSTTNNPQPSTWSRKSTRPSRT